MKMSAKSSSKLSVSAKAPTVKLGATSRTPAPNALSPAAKKDYSKKPKNPGFDFGNVNFGATGMTGES